MTNSEKSTAIWRFSIGNQIHVVEVQNADKLGKRILMIDGVQRDEDRHFFRRLRTQDYQIGKDIVSVDIDDDDSMEIKYSLSVNSRPLKEYQANQRKQIWFAPKKKDKSSELMGFNGKFQILFDQNYLELFVDGDKHKFDEVNIALRGNRRYFQIGNQNFNIWMQNNKVGKINFTASLYNEGELVPVIADPTEYVFAKD